MTDALREKLDTLALDILNKIKVGDPIDQSVLKAMDALTTVGKWYAIKNKVSTGDEEGKDIGEYQTRLTGQTGAGGTSAGFGGDADPEAVSDAADHVVAGDAAEPERGSGAPRKHRQARKANGGDFASGRGDPDNGGAELARYMASLPGNARGDADDQHDPRVKGGAVRGDRDRGPAVVEGDGESDLDELIRQ